MILSLAFWIWLSSSIPFDDLFLMVFVLASAIVAAGSTFKSTFGIAVSKSRILYILVTYIVKALPCDCTLTDSKTLHCTIKWVRRCLHPASCHPVPGLGWLWPHIVPNADSHWTWPLFHQHSWVWDCPWCQGEAYVHCFGLRHWDEEGWREFRQREDLQASEDLC